MRSSAVKARPLGTTSDGQEPAGRDGASATSAELEEHALATGADAGAASVAAVLLDAALAEGAVSVLDGGDRSAVAVTTGSRTRTPGASSTRSTPSSGHVGQAQRREARTGSRRRSAT